MKARIYVLVLVQLLLMTAGCSNRASSGQSYTLYRSSLVEGIKRIHIATFDAKDGGEDYNSENCELAANLFQKQPGVQTRFWCEKGTYKE